MLALTRAQYLTLTDLTVGLIKALLRDKLVPFLGGSISKPDIDDKRYREAYLPLEAVMMVMAKDLSRANGLNRRLACEVITRFPELTIGNVDRAETSPRDIFIAAVQWEEVKSDNHLWTFAGTLTEIEKQIEEYNDGDHLPARDIYRLTFVNMSRAVRAVRDRAVAAGIDLPAKWTV